MARRMLCPEAVHNQEPGIMGNEQSENEAEARPAARRPRGRRSEPGVPARVLVAEDQPEMRALLRRALQRRGYEVVEAGDGPGLVRAIIDGLLADEAQAPDLIVTDVRMPGFSGLEVLARLRREGWSTPVVIITAFGDAQVHHDAARLGAARVLNKPFEMDELCAVVESIVPASR